MNYSCQVPTLLIDEEKCRTNIIKMKSKADRNGLTLRPHFKTHQSKGVSVWFKEAGIRKITVSSVSMASHFSKEGFDEITIAFPVNVLEIDTINQLTECCHLNLLVESKETVDLISWQLKQVVGIFIKIDLGTKRTGIDSTNKELILELGKYIDGQDKMTFEGVLGHAGHSYNARSKEEILKVHQESMNKIDALYEVLTSEFPNLIYSYGDTPTCSHAENFGKVNEIRPGNFAFYDLTQHQIGSCHLSDIAAAVICPVVAKHEDRNQLIVYGGGVHFSKDRLILESGETVFGLLVHADNEKWNITEEKTYLSVLSQEHGTVQLLSGDNVENYHIGQQLLFLPVHSCMAANLLDNFRTTKDLKLEK